MKKILNQSNETKKKLDKSLLRKDYTKNYTEINSYLYKTFYAQKFDV